MHVGVASSQFGLVHAVHQFLQFDGERHVSFDLQFPRHEGHRGLQLPWNGITHVTMETTPPPACCPSLWRWLTWEHLAEVVRVHLHDNVSCDRRLALPRVAGAILQVQEPNAALFSWCGREHVSNTQTMSQRRWDWWGLVTWQVKLINSLRCLDDVLVDHSSDPIKRGFDPPRGRGRRWGWVFECGGRP